MYRVMMIKISITNYVHRLRDALHDKAVFVLKRDVKLQPTNLHRHAAIGFVDYQSKKKST